jgi:hypothetical protein
MELRSATIRILVEVSVFIKGSERRGVRHPFVELVDLGQRGTPAVLLTVVH